MTLIELLVVMAILSILVSSAIPVLSPAGDERRIREASRGVNAFLAGAQTRAIETGRPFGVMLRKLSQDTDRDADNGVCLELRYVEQPSPYAGFEDSSRVMVARSPYFDPAADDQSADTDPELLGRDDQGPIWLQFVAAPTAGATVFAPGIATDLVPPKTLQPGDRIDVAGSTYELINPPNNDNVNQQPGADGFFPARLTNANPLRLAARPVDSTGDRFISTSGVRLVTLGTSALKPAYNFDGSLIADVGIRTTATAPAVAHEAYWSEPLPYRIRRLPSTTLNDGYQLPEGSAIDLRASGLGDPANGGAVFFSDDDTDGNPATLSGVNNRDPIYIMFSPEGTVERVWGNDGLAGDAFESTPTTETLYLLVGLRENLPPSAAERDADFANGAGEGSDAEVQDRKARFNWLNPDARWVTVGARTGTVLTAENAFVDPAVIAGGSGFQVTSFPDVLEERRSREISAARALASQRAQTGGR